jgi:hypothetical protein
MGFFTKKAVPANDYMQMMGSAKKEVQTHLETSMESFENSFNDALTIFSEFASTKEAAKLKKAANEFLNLITLKPSRVEPYVYMAYILYLYDKKSEAIKYIKLSETIDSGYQYIKDVKALVYS